MRRPHPARRGGSLGGKLAQWRTGRALYAGYAVANAEGEGEMEGEGEAAAAAAAVEAGVALVGDGASRRDSLDGLADESWDDEIDREIEYLGGGDPDEGPDCDPDQPLRFGSFEDQSDTFNATRGGDSETSR